MTYMVMETHLSYSVVLDEAGRFLKVANMGYETGQIVDEVYEMKSSEESNFKPMRLITLVGSFAACFFLIFSFYLSSLPTSFAFIYLEINPEICMDVSEDGRVVELVPLNDDASTLLEGYDGKRKDMALVANELLTRAVQMEFLSDGGKVTVLIDSPDEIWFQDTGITLRQSLQEHLDEGVSVTIEIKAYAESDDPTDSASASEELPSSEPSETAASQPPADTQPVPESSASETTTSQPPADTQLAPESPRSLQPQQSAESPPSSSASHSGDSDYSGYSNYENSSYSAYSGYSNYENSNYSAYSDYSNYGNSSYSDYSGYS